MKLSCSIINSIILYGIFILFDGCGKTTKDDKNKIWIGDWYCSRKEGDFYLFIDNNSKATYREDLGSGNETSYKGKSRFTDKQINFGTGLKTSIQHLDILEEPTSVPASDSIWVPHFYRIKLATWKVRLRSTHFYALGTDEFYK